MSVKKFKFVSPGVFTKEIDNSQLPAANLPAGPVVIGRMPSGPGMKPVKIDSFSDFVQVFGNPVSGKKSGDVWREGNHQGPTYASYAAQAYLAANVGSITAMRLLGYAHEGATPAGYAGWQTTNTDASPTPVNNGGAFGLFLAPSASSPTPASLDNAHLAAIWYVNSGSTIALSGTAAGGNPATAHTAAVGVMIDSTGTDADFSALIFNKTGAEVTKIKFNFNDSSANFIRKVFNTNPQNTNGTVVPATNFNYGEHDYWLGETFESTVYDKIPIKAGVLGWILPLNNKAEYRMDAREAHTGWFFAQDLSSDTAAYEASNMQKLFRIHSLDAGQWSQENLKISIQDLSYSRNTTGAEPFGSFTVLVRKASDTDAVVEIVERYSNCNLNPTSDNYIGRKIGTRYQVWDSSTRSLKTYGNYNNQSNYIRVEMDDAVENGQINTDCLPYGVFGPPKYLDTTLTKLNQVISPNSIIQSGSDSFAAAPSTALDSGSYNSITSVTMKFPSLPVRISASAGVSNPKNAYFGATTSTYMELEKNTSSRNNRSGPGYNDYIYPLFDDFVGADVPSASGAGVKLQYQWIFSLDDLVQTGSVGIFWESGSRANNAHSINTGSWRNNIDMGYTKFTTPMFNGFDGLDIKEIEPFRNTLLDDGNDTINYASNTVRRAIDTVADPEVVDCNLITMPGLTNPTLTEHMIQVCEDRGDALALIDIPDVYTPFTEGSTEYASVTDRVGSVTTAVNNLENRQINTSYGCTYYPWVQIRDTVSGGLLWVPPSVVALGTFASSEAKSELWFAPAGFNRGGLSEGSAGLPVLAVSQRLSSSDRDTLYEANINPIASFPNEGIVIFGQKTLHLTPSALDRINVRRMMIFVKKQISAVANGILFDQNVRVTWNRFTSKADPILRSVQNRLGISEYRFILDETTTTPDLVDQNIVYAKVYVKPAKAIEYIAIDFIITNTGAAFED